MQRVSENTKATLLLVAPLLKYNKKELIKPLNTKEYNNIRQILYKSNYEPKDLLKKLSLTKILPTLSAYISTERIEALLNRGFLLSQCLEYWSLRNIWVISRADSTYPVAYKDKLKNNAPLLIYGCGNINLLNTHVNIAIVGSREINDNIKEYALQKGKFLAELSATVISGGAKGSDKISMLSCLKNNGTSCGILANNLSTEVVNKEYINYLNDNKLLLISMVDPDTRFYVANAMARNKYIYALSNAGLVVNSDFNKGGTWAGAIEVLKNNTEYPLYLRETDTQNKAFQELIKLGANWWSNPKTLNDLIKMYCKPSKNKLLTTYVPPELIITQENINSDNLKENSHEEYFFSVFSTRIQHFLNTQKNKADIITHFNFINKSTLNSWLERLEQMSILKTLKIKSKIYYKLSDSAANNYVPSDLFD